jgi:alkanesulfonate monooxygenase SsuD/methylene tetrahydromethanopterin reductase-like flavin-dependent oxidoreductase (luciferase family)
MPALTAAAAATRTLRVGTFVLAAGWRNPALLAQECATLDILSDGRFELGLGAGIGREDAERAELPVNSPGALMRCGVGGRWSRGPLLQD